MFPAMRSASGLECEHSACGGRNHSDGTEEMRQLLIIADDLSGAADCANACRSAGLSAVVAFDANHPCLSSDVLAIDCDSRHLNAEEAAARVRDGMRAFDLSDPDLMVFKKVDSALRGNVGAELAAALAEMRKTDLDGKRTVAVMAPAFPLRGRTTVGGQQRVHGEPVHESEMWGHEGLTGPSHIPSMLARLGLGCVSVDLDVIRSGELALREELQRAAAAADVVVCDAETNDDLSAIAHASIALGPRTLWVGSAGLAYHLPHAAGMRCCATKSELPALREGPILFVLGSMSSVSREQASALAMDPAVHAIHVKARMLLGGSNTAAWKEVATRIESLLQSGWDTLVMLEAEEEIEQKDRRSLTNALGGMLAPLRDRVGALMASGGETARAVLVGWGAVSLQLLEEVEPGLPFSIAACGESSLAVLTKAGAFGEPDTWARCRAFLHDRKQNSKAREAHRGL
jgi:uncharacterized protein YgbK (DUF1537 family)